MENFNFSKVSKTVPNSVQTCSELVLRYFFRKGMAILHWRVEIWKNSKINRKNSNFQKCPKTYPTVFKHVTRWFFLKSSCTAGSKNGKNEKIIGVLKFQKCPKVFLKVSKHALNLFWGNFLRKKCPVHPGMSKLGTTSRNWKNYHIFKMPKNAPKSNQTCFEHDSRKFVR